MSDAAIASIATALVTIVTMVIGFLTLWLKLRYGVEEKAKTVEKKLDQNTQITRAGQVVATTSAQIAVEAATDVKSATEAMSRTMERKLNGGIDSAIQNTIEPMQRMMREHSAVDEKNMQEVNKKIEELNTYVHQRNHEILTAMQVQNNKLEIIIRKLEGQ